MLQGHYELAVRPPGWHAARRAAPTHCAQVCMYTGKGFEETEVNEVHACELFGCGAWILWR